MRIYEDLRIVQGRLAILQSMVVGLLALLLIHFWNLQVVRGRYFRALAENNRTRAVPLAAPRGALLDRNGLVLVENRPVLQRGADPGAQRRPRRRGGAAQPGPRARRGRGPRAAGPAPSPFHPVVVKTDASLEDVAALEARRMELPEVNVDVVPLRAYPLASAAAHALGRVGEITERQIESREFDGLEAGALVGQAGLESQYNRSLMGRDGYRRVVVNSQRGRGRQKPARQPPVDGPSLTLTLDSALQAAVERAFAGRAGSAVALEPETGEILAMTSIPAYDPNLLHDRVSTPLSGAGSPPIPRRPS